jgi:ABC-type transport system involved in multi-copper enzyme maturation permease subunit
MSQVATAETIAHGPGNVDRVPFSRLVRVELRKTYDTRAGFWLLLSLALITFAATTLFLIFDKTRSDLSMLNFVSFGSFFQALLLPVLGILAVTSEWSQRTGLVTFTLEPSRSRVLASKLVAVVFLGIAAAVILLAFSAVYTVIAGALFEDGGAWNFGAYDLLQLFVQQMMYILSGLAFGMILLNSAVAIVLSFMLPTVFSILVNVISWLQDAAPWLDKNTALQDFLVEDATVNGSDWAHAAVTSLWWVWIPLALGAYRVIRSEVKSA